MPITQTAFRAISPDLAVWLDMLVDQRTRKEIASTAGVAESTLRDHLARLENLVGAADQRELVRWWRENRVPWVRWLLDCLHVDPQELIG